MKADGGYMMADERMLEHPRDENGWWAGGKVSQLTSSPGVFLMIEAIDFLTSRMKMRSPMTPP